MRHKSMSLIAVLTLSAASFGQTTKPTTKPAFTPLMTGKMIWTTYDPPARGEFEENAEYEKRVPKIDTTNTVYIDISKAVAIPKYDMDRKVMIVRLSVSEGTRLKKLDGPVISLDDELVVGKTAGQNAFGARREIRTMAGAVYEASIPNLREFASLKIQENAPLVGIRFADIEFPLSVDQAKRLKFSAKVIIGVTLGGKDKAETIDMSSTPNARSDISSSYVAHVIGATVQSLTVIDKSSDAVVYRH